MGLLNLNELAEATVRHKNLFGWANVFGGLGVTSFIFAAFNGWHGALIAIGVILIICWFAIRVRANALLHDAISSAALEAAFPFNMSFDQTWIPVVQKVYRDAREVSVRTGVSLDITYQKLFTALLVERGFERRF